ncbi:MAG: hypothetical protein IPM23_07740 [Candidatus Melainabacteria bacterium]|nr:hypothetical protein [Candidatus Melainabacteria bacterium]
MIASHVRKNSVWFTLLGAACLLALTVLADHPRQPSRAVMASVPPSAGPTDGHWRGLLTVTKCESTPAYFKDSPADAAVDFQLYQPSRKAVASLVFNPTSRAFSTDVTLCMRPEESEHILGDRTSRIFLAFTDFSSENTFTDSRDSACSGQVISRVVDFTDGNQTHERVVIKTTAVNRQSSAMKTFSTVHDIWLTPRCRNQINIRVKEDQYSARGDLWMSFEMEGVIERL